MTAIGHEAPRPDTDRWWTRAACAELSKSMFFPEKGQQRLAANAKAVCATCPVTDQCLNDALSLPIDPGGIWGGTTREERRALRRRTRSEVVA